MKPLLIWDYDGVIINSKEAWLYAFQETMKKLGHKFTLPQILDKVGPKTEKVIEMFLPEKEKHLAGKGKEIIDEVVSTEGLEKANLCPNAKEVLEKLRKQNFKMVLLTNSDSLFVYRGLEKFGLNGNLFDLVITADDPFENKEAAIRFILASFEYENGNAVYIADKHGDIDIARNTGVKSIIVTNEFSWEKEEVIRAANPDFLIKDLNELENILKKI